MTMPTTERRYEVFLADRVIGVLNQRDDYTWFVFSDDYLDDPGRAVLGLMFEQDLTGRYASQLRLPQWFSNLLPEGQLREWIALERGVHVDREMELLAQVGHDLPGAVRVLSADGPIDSAWDPTKTSTDPYRDRTEGAWAEKVGFSLAGVGLKFSMLREGDRLTLPAHGAGGDWIVKLPDPVYPDLPRNEHAVMSLAAAAGIDVPEHWLADRDQIEELPINAWPNGERYAYVIRRFDRDAERRPVHIEDFAQVRNRYPQDKYQGNYETVANLIYRGRDTAGLQEFARRLAFNVLVSNGDGHLKNWSLIYRDPRRPSLSPAYDLVSTLLYRDEEDLGLKFHSNRRLERVTLADFEWLEWKLGAGGAELAEHAAITVRRAMDAWPEIAETLADCAQLRAGIEASITERYKTLMKGTE
jgi:serine/threonine-protein kinase HipA